jgi:hypothetical protein
MEWRYCSTQFESQHYTEATERSPVDGGDNGALGFLFSAYRCILFKLPLTFVKESKMLVARAGYENVLSRI